MSLNSTETAVPNFFADGSPFLEHPLLTAERTSLEVDFIESELRLKAGGRILDVGCGFGRHSIELARRGYQVTGIDPSLAMIVAARQKAQESGVTVDFRLEWGEYFQSKQSYEAAICLFTTLGQISDKGKNDSLVEQVYALLEPDACLVIEVPQREVAVRNLKKQESIGAGEQLIQVQRSYDAQTQIVTEKFRVGKEENQQTYWLQYRLYDRQELESRLKRAGFCVLAVYGDYMRACASDTGATLLAVARKVV